MTLSGVFGGADALHMSFVADTGHINGFAALDTTDVGVESGMRRVRGVRTVPNPTPGLNRQPVEGDDYRIDTIDYVSADIQSGIIEAAVEDFDAEEAMQGSTVFTMDTLWDMHIRGVSDPTLARMAILVTTKAKKQDAANRGQKAFKNKLYPNVTLYPMGEDQSTFQTNATVRYDMTVNPFNILPWGDDLDDGNFTVEDGNCLVWYSDYPCHIVAFIGDGTAGALSVDYAPIEVARTKVIKDVAGVITIAAPTSVNVSGKTVTPAATVASGARGLVIYECLRFPK